MKEGVVVELVEQLEGGEEAVEDEGRPAIAAMDRDSRKARAMIAEARPLGDLDQKLGFFG